MHITELHIRLSESETLGRGPRNLYFHRPSSDPDINSSLSYSHKVRGYGNSCKSEKHHHHNTNYQKDETAEKQVNSKW